MIRASRFGIAIVLAYLVMPGSGGAQTARPEPVWQVQVDRVFAEWDRADSPGCALALYKDGAIVYERGYGVANLEHGVPITPETVFYIGSLSKQFTAMAAALAMQQGKLRADDDVRKYLPELPDYGRPITLRHLIHHTSGLRDINTLLAIGGRRSDEAFDNEEVLRIVARQKALNFNPGDDYLYSNTGYAFLALAIERATGTPFSMFADLNIFKPVGMTVTHFHDDLSRIVKHRADAYDRLADGGLRLNTPYNQRSGAGGVFTTVRELLRWDENFYHARVGGRAVIEELQTPARLNDGTALTYAWGLQVTKYRGRRIVEHGGSLGGFRAHLIRFPDEHFSVACLCNLGSIAPGTLSRQVADIYLADRLTEPIRRPSSTAATEGSGGQSAPERKMSSLPAETIGQCAGEYYSDELDTKFSISVRNGALVLRRGERDEEPLEPGRPGEFRAGSMTLRFVRGGGANISGLSVDAGRVRDLRFVKQN